MRQLWRPVLESGQVRIAPRRGTTSDRVGSTWHDVESYRAVPTLARAQLLVPDEHRRVAAAALTNYRGLRPPVTNAQRMTLGTWARLGLPIAPGRVVLQRRAGAEAEVPMPLEVLATRLGHPRLFASVGIRPGANGKATLQLLTADGAPAGFAKFAWSPSTALFVRNEAEVLARLHGGTGRVRVPSLLAEGSWHENPFLVSSPLPADSRGARAEGALLGVAELADLCPLQGRRAVGGTDHFRRLAVRTRELTGSPLTRELAEAALALLGLVEAHTEALPVATHWHGDLTPWNTARDADGLLWCWDWESSEPDAVAGLDALHWMWSIRRERGDTVDGSLLPAALEASAGHLRGLGVPRGSWVTVAVLYALTVVERACTLARDASGWEHLWITPAQLHDIMRACRSLAEASPPSREEHVEP